MDSLSTLLWQLLKPHSHIVAGLYLALLIVGTLGLLGYALLEVTSRLTAWWERRWGPAFLAARPEVAIFVLTLAALCTLALLFILACDGLVPDEWSALMAQS